MSSIVIDVSVCKWRLIARSYILVRDAKKKNGKNHWCRSFNRTQNSSKSMLSVGVNKCCVFCFCFYLGILSLTML